MKKEPRRFHLPLDPTFNYDGLRIDLFGMGCLQDGIRALKTQCRLPSQGQKK